MAASPLVLLLLALSLAGRCAGCSGAVRSPLRPVLGRRRAVRGTGAPSRGERLGRVAMSGGEEVSPGPVGRGGAGRGEEASPGRKGNEGARYGETWRGSDASPALVGQGEAGEGSVASPAVQHVGTGHNGPSRRARGAFSMARRSSFRALALSALIALDITCYAFPLPFLPAHLAELGYGEGATSRILSSFSLSALLAGVILVVNEASRSTTRSARRRCILLGASSLAMSLTCAAQAFWPSFSVIYACRLLQGALSQLAWTMALAFAASLGPVSGLSAVAWVMVGNSIGEVSGPVFGASLYSIGGFRLPFLVSAIVALGLSAAFLLSALAERGASVSTAAHKNLEPRGAAARLAASNEGSSTQSTSCISHPCAAPVAGEESQQQGEGAAAAPAILNIVPPERSRTMDEGAKGDSGGESRSAPTARAAALGDSRALALSLTLALCCGLIRSALDIILPMWLRRQHAFGVTPIARASVLATVFFVAGSALSGRLIENLATRRRDSALATGVVVGCAAAATVLLPAHAWGVIAAFCTFYAASAFVGVTATAALEERGSEIGAADAILALSTLLWTAGFAVGGIVANIALAGAASMTRQRLVMGCVGLVNALCVATAVLTRRRRGRKEGSGEIF